MARVLSLDDEPAILSLVGTLLERWGYEFAGTTDEQEALARLRTEPVDLFTLDLSHPGLGGFALLRAIRLDPELRGVPVLVISGLSGEKGAQGFQRLGMDMDRDVDGHLRKPFDARQLQDAVAAVLRKRHIPLPPGPRHAQEGERTE